jgi:C-terminal processing protease CtpA/Prc
LNLPAATVYTKPFIVLVDEFSISAADIFPAMIQDNARAPLVGMRTNGGGGSTSSWPPGVYSECLASNTNTLVWRKNPIVTPEYPTANYVENIGARPDVPLDYMTRENLLSGGRVFVQAFTRIVTDWIRANR